MNAFWLCFVPMFVAVDALGVLPMFVSLTGDMTPASRRTAVYQSVVTASVISAVFVWLGPLLLRYLGITMADFLIAGGALLFAIALSDLLSGEKRQREVDRDSLGVVPIGIPLIAGPAVLTTCMLFTHIHGEWVTFTATVCNIMIAGGLFLAAGPITRAIGRTGTKAASKVASLLLASIAVMLVRKGITGL